MYINKRHESLPSKVNSDCGAVDGAAGDRAACCGVVAGRYVTLQVKGFLRLHEDFTITDITIKWTLGRAGIRHANQPMAFQFHVYLPCGLTPVVS